MDLKLNIEYLSIYKLTPYAKNARKHEPEDIATIKASIEAFGMCDPIGVWGGKNIIVEGHGRLLALKELGYTEAPCIRLDHLDDEQRRAYALAHNKTAEMSKWDFGMLDAELCEIANIDMGDFGFVDDVFDETDLDVEDMTEEKFSCKFTFDSYNDYIQHENELKEYSSKIGAIFSVNKS